MLRFHWSILSLATAAMGSQEIFTDPYPGIWRKTYISDSTLQEWTMKFVSMDNKIKCAAQAERYESGLFCISNGGCYLTALSRSSSNSPDEIEDPVNCWAYYEPRECKNSEGNDVEEGQEVDEMCGKIKCENDELIETEETLPPSPLPKSKCLDSFTMHESLGCIKHYSQKKNWCDARSSCRSDGGDLITFDENNVQQLRQYLDRNGMEGKELWVGLHRHGTQWQFVLGKVPFDVESPLWMEREPNTGLGVHVCARLRGVLVGDKTCEPTKFPYICQIPLKTHSGADEPDDQDD